MKCRVGTNRCCSDHQGLPLKTALLFLPRCAYKQQFRKTMHLNTDVDPLILFHVHIYSITRPYASLSAIHQCPFVAVAIVHSIVTVSD
jgi:hypothetical protein